MDLLNLISNYEKEFPSDFSLFLFHIQQIKCKLSVLNSE